MANESMFYEIFLPLINLKLFYSFFFKGNYIEIKDLVYIKFLKQTLL